MTWNFTEKEIKQIKSLVKDWASGRIMPLDCRKEATKNVRDYGFCSSLLIKGDDESLDFYRETENIKPTRWYINNIISLKKFDLLYNLPVLILWELIKPILQDHEGWKTGTGIGYSITKNSKWFELNLVPSADKFHTDYDLSEMIRILDKLATHQYIIFQRGGSIWNISIL